MIEREETETRYFPPNWPLIQKWSISIKSLKVWYQKVPRYYGNLYCILFPPFFQVVVFILTLQCAFGLPDPGKAGKQCTLVRSPTNTGKNLWIRRLLLSIHVGFYNMVIIFKLTNQSLPGWIWFVLYGFFLSSFFATHGLIPVQTLFSTCPCCFKLKSPSYLIKNYSHKTGQL